MNAQAYSNWHAYQQNGLLTDHGFKTVLILVLGSFALLLLPAVIVGAIAAVTFGLLKFRWWTLLLAALVVFGTFASLDMAQQSASRR